MKLNTKIAFALIIILVTVFLSSCETKNVSIEQTVTKIAGRSISIYEIDSCEYIGNVYGGQGDMITHKGNCKFCIKRNKIINFN